MSIEDERQAAEALGPDRDRVDRLARERQADVERIAEAIYVRSVAGLTTEVTFGTRLDAAHSAFESAAAFVAARDERRKK